MAVPKFFEFFPYTLRVLSEHEAMKTTDLYAAVAKLTELSEADMQETLPRGSVRTYVDRIFWSTQYLMHAGLVDRVARATYQITDEGRRVLRSGDSIDVAYLKRYESFRKFYCPNKPEEPKPTPWPNGWTPQEVLELAYDELHHDLAQRLMDAIMKSSPDFFERMVVDLLLAMGYGYDSKTSGLVTGKSGDGGIDGIINEDKLGFDRIYVQAKRWNDKHTVSGPDIQTFIGALINRGATKGLYITTSRFTDAAQKAADSAQSLRIVLVDGDQLTRLMIAHGVGVSVKQVYELKQMDSDYFDAEN